MKIKLYPSIILGILLFGSTLAPGQNNLTVVVPNIKSIKGAIKVCLVMEQSDYLKDCYKEVSVVVKSEAVSTTFENVPSGMYVITLFHDKNNDNELNKNFLGIPKEAYGFSNNVLARFGPPSFEKCQFSIEKDMTIQIKL